MAKAEGDFTLEWRPLKCAVDLVVAELGTRDLAMDKVLCQLRDGRLHYRYREYPSAIEHPNDLPELFWRVAIINWAESSAYCQAYETGQDYCAIYQIEVLLPIEDAAAVSTEARPKGKPGRPSEVDWDAIEAVFQLRIGELGLPDRDNEKGWRTKADVIRWVRRLLADRNESAADSTIRDHLGSMLKRLETTPKK
jgi:hypothetical protein